MDYGNFQLLKLTIEEVDPRPGLIEESNAFNHAVAHPAARKHMQAFLQQGGQTAEVESGALEDLLRRLP